MKFSLRFPASEILYWAGRYSYAYGDAEVLQIGARSGKAGHYTKRDFIAVCDWKTRGRVRRHYENNPEEDVRKFTEIALATSDEQTRITALTVLRGVRLPTASALLHFAAPDLYPLLDFRALWSLNCGKKYYSIPFWLEYLSFCRELAHDSNVSLRELDRALGEYSKRNQKSKCGQDLSQGLSKG